MQKYLNACPEIKQSFFFCLKVYFSFCNQLQVLPFHTNDSPWPELCKQHPATSIYLQINSAQIPKEASKKFHTFVTQRTKWPQREGGRGGGDAEGVWKRESNKTLTDEVGINV